MAVVLLLWIAVSRRLRLYCIPNEIRPTTIARWSAENTVAICAVTVLAAFFSRQWGAGASRMFVVCLAPVTFAVFASTRCAALGIVALLQRRGHLPRIAVVGDPKQVNSLIRSLESRIATTIRGVITPENTLSGEAVALNVPVLGTTKHVAELVNREQIDYAIIIQRSLPDPEAEHCKRVFWRMGLPVSYVLDVARERNWTCDGLRLYQQLELSKRHGLSAVEVRPILASTSQHLVKRAFDVGLSALLLVVLGPSLVLIALIVKITSAGPVLDRKLHFGKGSRHFNCLKFRTTHIHDSTRTTAIGRFLIRYRGDELPELANVVRGKMSFVGPAAVPVDALEMHALSQAEIAWFETRSLVQPGLTGLWQLSHSISCLNDMLQLDFEYARNRSFSLDLSILLRTPIPVIRGIRFHLPAFRRSVLNTTASAS